METTLSLKPDNKCYPHYSPRCIMVLFGGGAFLGVGQFMFREKSLDGWRGCRFRAGIDLGWL